MKKNIVLAIASVALVAFASCQKTPVVAEKADGYLSFSQFSLGLDETVETKASAASGNYTISIYDAEETLVAQKTYAEVKNNDSKISLPAGNYTLVASSSAEEVPASGCCERSHLMTPDTWPVPVGRLIIMGYSYGAVAPLYLPTPPLS